MKTVVKTCLTAAAIACGAAALAQGRGDAVGEQLFPPELILQHQSAIALGDAQRSALVAEVKRTQAAALEPQVELQRRVERLVELLKPDRIDEPQALAQLDQVLAAEREVKRQHIALAVRLKALLSPEQIRQLRALRTR